MRRSAKQLQKAIIELARARAPKSICPSDVARSVAPQSWRELMQPVRDAAAVLEERGELFITQGADRVAADAKGPLRFRLPYRVGRGEEGVLTIEPYKSELLPLWQFATPSTARRSAQQLWKQFTAYGRAHDFAGMDMARKFLQMGMTRATRYARHRSGKKYSHGRVLPLAPDAVKAKSAAIFKTMWLRALKNRTYLRLKRGWRIGKR